MFAGAISLVAFDSAFGTTTTFCCEIVASKPSFSGYHCSLGLIHRRDIAFFAFYVAFVRHGIVEVDECVGVHLPVIPIGFCSCAHANK